MKKIISLLLAFTMIAATTPFTFASAAGSFDLPNVQETKGFDSYKYAANASTSTGSDFTEMPDITVIGSGVSTGTKLYGTEIAATSYEEGDSLNEKLADGYYFSISDVVGAEKKYPKDATSHSSTNWFTPANGTNKMVKFTEANSGIKFSWNEAQDVARLHLWAWPADAIKAYDILVESNGEMKKVLEGSLDYDISNPTGSNASFYVINLPTTYNTTELQFIIKELNGEEAYITEVVPRSTVDIDLASINPRAGISQNLDNISAKSPAIYTGEVISGYFQGTTTRSNMDESLGFYSNIFTADTSAGGFFYNLNTTGPSKYNLGLYNFKFGPQVNGIESDAFYAVDFGETKQTVNRVKNMSINFLSGSLIEDVQLYYTDSATAFSSLKTNGNDISGWELAGCVKRGSVGNYTTHTADFDTTAKARYWMVRFVLNAANGRSMAPSIGMYNLTLPDEYIPPTEAECVEMDMAEIKEGITAVGDGTMFPMTGTNGSTISVTSDNDIVTIEEDGNNWKIVAGAPAEDTTVTITVTVTCGDESAEETYTMNLTASDEECVRLDKLEIENLVTEITDGTIIPKGGSHGSQITVIEDSDLISVVDDTTSWKITVDEIITEETTVPVIIKVERGVASDEILYSMELAIGDEGYVLLDYKEITESITEVENGTLIPKEGTYGSVITVTANNSLVSVESDGEYWKLVSDFPAEDTTVNVTVTVAIGDVSRAKNYTLILTVDPEDVRDDSTVNILNLPYIYSYDYAPATKVKALGEGVESGDKAYGEDVEVNNYNEGDRLPQLSDGYYFTYTEYRWAGQKGTTEKAVTGLDVMKTSQNTSKMVKFTEENSGFEFSWRGSQDVSRLHLWAWPADSIDEYEVQIPDGDGWRTIKAGSLNNEIGKTPSETNSTFYSVILDEKVNVEKIRFVIKSFNENYGYSYITEAVPRKSNEINLTSINPLRAANQDTTLNATAANSSYSPYIENSILAGSNGYWTGGTNRLNAWACDNDELPALGTYKHSSYNYWSTKYNNDYVDAYYLVSFGESKQKINRIKISTKVSSADKYKVVLYASNDSYEYSKHLQAEEIYNPQDMSAWLKVAETTISNSAAIDIKGVPEARYFKMVIKNADEENNTQFAPFAFYSLREDELSSDAILASADPIPEPSEPPAPVIKGELEKAVSLFGTFEGEASLLTDKTRLSYKEWRVLAQVPGVGYDNARPYKQKDLFVKFSGNRSGLEWSSEVDETVSSLDLWAWPAYAIDDYEVQNYNDETNSWETIKTGTLNPKNYSLGNGAAENSANSTFWYSIILNEPVVTNRLRLVIKSFTDANAGVYIAEADIRDTNEINLIATTAGQNDGEGFSIYAQSYKVSASNAYTTAPADTSWRGWPFGSAAGTVSADSAGNFYYAVSFADSMHKINKGSIKVSSGKIEEFEVWYADGIDAWEKPEEDNNWTKLTTIRGNFTSTAEFELADAPYATYWKIKPVRFSDDAKLSSAALYEVADEEISLFARSLNQVYDSVTSELAITSGLNLATSVNTTAGVMSITWECDSNNVNTTTGAVTRMEEDEPIILRACIAAPGGTGAAYVLEKPYWVLGLHEAARATLVDEEFTASAEETFAEVEGDVSVVNGKASITNGASALYELSFDEKFVFNGHSKIVIEIDSSTNGGTIQFLNNSKEVLVLDIHGNTTEVRFGDATTRIDTPDSLTVEFLDDVFNLSSEGEILLYREKLTNAGGVDAVKFAAEAGKSLSLTKICSDALSSDFIEEIEEQFDFSKISEDGSANLLGNLNLINTLSDIAFAYTSSDVAVNPETGVVDLSALKKVNVVVTATSPGGNFSKNFNVMTSGMENVLNGSLVSVSGLTRTGYPASNAGDDDIDTMFISESATDWALTVGMPEKRYFNKIRLYEADAEGTINSYKLSISDDGWNYREIYNGTTITDGELITIGTYSARYVKLTATVSGPGSGLYEFCAYLDQNSEEIVELDYAEVVGKIENVANGNTFVKTGPFGSSISVTSDNEIVSIVEENGKFKVVENTTDKETHVNVTVTVQLGEVSKTKVYEMIVLADTSNIRDNEISGGGSGGGGGGGGSNSGKDSDLEGTHIAISENAPSEPLETIYDVYKKELDGHWGENQIWTLISEKIVVGDGKSLKLSSSVTRAEVLKMIMMTFGIETAPYEGGFLDVSEDDWYSNYAATALKKGLMVGDGINFRGNDSISRQEVAVVLANVLKQEGISVDADDASLFKDTESIAPWAIESVMFVSELGLVKGYENGEFQPANNIRRDEAMVLISRTMEFIRTYRTEVAK